MAAAVVTIITLSGYLSSIGRVGAPGFGYYSMNLLSPVSPQMSGLIPARRSFFLDATGGQYEGFNYLGAGALFLVIATVHPSAESSLDVLRKWRQALSRAWPGHACLMMVLWSLTGLALSNTVFLGPWRVAAVPLPDWMLQILEVFRSSGRFFWPALYCIVALAVTAAAPRYRRAGPATLLAACVLQWLDAAPLRAAVANSAATAVPPVIDVETWHRALSRHESIRILPSFACLNMPPYDWTWSRQFALQVQLLAGLAGVETQYGLCRSRIERLHRRSAIGGRRRSPGPRRAHRFSLRVAGVRKNGRGRCQERQPLPGQLTVCGVRPGYSATRSAVAASDQASGITAHRARV
jgi:hypothetical protein